MPFATEDIYCAGVNDMDTDSQFIQPLTDVNTIARSPEDESTFLSYCSNRSTLIRQMFGHLRPSIEEICSFAAELKRPADQAVYLPLQFSKLIVCHSSCGQQISGCN